MKRHTKRLQAQLVRKTKFAEAEEVFVEVFSEVAADELLAAVIEGADAVCTCMVAQSRSLKEISELRAVPCLVVHTNRSARCDFILSCTTPSLVLSLSTSSFT